MKRQPQVSISRREVTEIHTKLDRMDEAIRGNGHPGIKQRLERLEEAEDSRRRLSWIVIGAFVAAGASALMQLVQLLVGR
jgi:hypothetical protein